MRGAPAISDEYRPVFRRLLRAAGVLIEFAAGKGGDGHVGVRYFDLVGTLLHWLRRCARFWELGRDDDLPAAVSGGLVGDLPDAIDPQQIVEVDIPAGLVRGPVPADLDRSCVSDLSDRDEATDDAPTGRRSPPLEALGDQVFMKDSVRLDIEDPRVLVKRLLELADIIVVETVDVELHDANDLVVVVCSRSHRDLLPFKATFSRSTGYTGCAPAPPTAGSTCTAISGPSKGGIVRLAGNG